VTKAKRRYYRSKIENVKHLDQAKWYQTIYKLAAAEELACAHPVLPCTTVCENSRDCLSSYSDLSSRLSLAKNI
jgi:hypothetical protein